MTGSKRSLKDTVPGNDKAGNLVIVKAKKLNEEGKTGVVAKGIYERMDEETSGKFKGSRSYFVRDAAADTLYIINGTQSLNEQLGQLNPADKTEVEIIYSGKTQTKAGNDFHQFEVMVNA
jgi:hypothetical protein